MADELSRLRALAKAVAAYRTAFQRRERAVEQVMAAEPINQRAYKRALKLAEAMHTRQSEMFHALDRLAG
jgi:hypothetical protein